LVDAQRRQGRPLAEKPPWKRDESQTLEKLAGFTKFYNSSAARKGGPARRAPQKKAAARRATAWTRHSTKTSDGARPNQAARSTSASSPTASGSFLAPRRGPLAR
jgi:hypothetical protein